MKICYFGIYNPDYARNRVILKGLKDNNIEVIQCQSNLTGMRKYFDLIKKHWRIRHNYDLMIVGFPGHQMILLAKLLTKKPIVFDVFLSLYDSMVLDRQIYSIGSFRARYCLFLDKFSVKLAKVVILDTQKYIDYFVEHLNLPREKFVRLFVGADDSVMYPQSAKNLTGKFLVHFHGNFIPLQGVEYVIKAAKILEKESVIFNVIGGGQEYKKVKKIADNLAVKNVNFITAVSYEKLAEYINQADLCLGIFGQTEKTQRVVPNKVYEAVACHKPIITSRTDAIIELFIDGRNILLCNPADEEDLVLKIIKLKNNPELRTEIAQAGYELFKSKLTPAILVGGLINQLKQLCNL